MEFDTAMKKIIEDLAKSRTMLDDIRRHRYSFTEEEYKHLKKAIRLNMRLLNKDLKEMRGY